MNCDFPTRHAHSVDNIHITYKCPYSNDICSAKHHRHGSCRHTKNRKTHRVSHCDGDRKLGYNGIYLVVDDDTKKL